MLLKMSFFLIDWELNVTLLWYRQIYHKEDTMIMYKWWIFSLGTCQEFNQSLQWLLEANKGIEPSHQTRTSLQISLAMSHSKKIWRLDSTLPLQDGQETSGIRYHETRGLNGVEVCQAFQNLMSVQQPTWKRNESARWMPLECKWLEVS